MSKEIKLLLISGAISITTSLLTIKLERWSVKNKNKREDFSNLIKENSEVIKILLDIIRGTKFEKINFYELKKLLESKNSNLLFVTNKKLSKLFIKLHTNINKQGTELSENFFKIKKISKKIIKKITKVGGRICDIN